MCLLLLIRRRGTVRMGELIEATGETAERIREALQALGDLGFVQRTGERALTRYHLLPFCGSGDREETRPGGERSSPAGIQEWRTESEGDE